MLVYAIFKTQLNVENETLRFYSSSRYFIPKNLSITELFIHYICLLSPHSLVLCKIENI